MAHNGGGNGLVVKADALAGGKGVVVATDREKALEALYNFMKNPHCSVKTQGILLEERLQGREVSAFALCDGRDFIPLGYVCDYKRVGEGDTGPNTGGMGCYVPRTWPSQKTRQFIEEKNHGARS